MSEPEPAMSRDLGRLSTLPRARLGHTPTWLETMPNLEARIGGVEGEPEVGSQVAVKGTVAEDIIMASEVEIEE